MFLLILIESYLFCLQMKCWLAADLVNYGNAKFVKKLSRVELARWPNITLKCIKCNLFSRVTRVITPVERRRCTRLTVWVTLSSILVSTAERFSVSIRVSSITWIRTPTSVNSSVIFARRSSTRPSTSIPINVKSTETRRRYFVHKQYNIWPVK